MIFIFYFLSPWQFLGRGTPRTFKMHQQRKRLDTITAIGHEYDHEYETEISNRKSEKAEKSPEKN